VDGGPKRGIHITVVHVKERIGSRMREMILGDEAFHGAK
jgi:hypothetical protein